MPRPDRLKRIAGQEHCRGLIVAGAATFIGYAVWLFFRNFSDSFLEVGIGAEQVDVPKAQIEELSPSLVDYISHLQPAVAGFVAAAGLAALLLTWFGARRGYLWAWASAVAVPVAGLAVALPSHFPYGFDTFGHLGLVYLATGVFVVGADRPDGAQGRSELGQPARAPLIPGPRRNSRIVALVRR